MGYLDSTKIQNYSGEFFEIEKFTDYVKFTSNLENVDSKGSYKDSNYVNYMSSLLTKNEYIDVLVSGLGLGVMPQWLASEKNSNIDVIEINQELIDAVNNMGYLSDKISLIQSDIYQYTTSKKYDLIYFDHWFFPDVDYNNQRDGLKNTFLNNKKTNSSIIFPINKEIF